MPLFAIAHALHLEGGGYAIRCPELPGCEARNLDLQLARKQFSAALSERVLSMMKAGDRPPLYTFEELECRFATHCSTQVAASDRRRGTFDTVIAVRAKLPPEAAERLAAMPGLHARENLGPGSGPNGGGAGAPPTLVPDPEAVAAAPAGAVVPDAAATAPITALLAAAAPMAMAVDAAVPAETAATAPLEPAAAERVAAGPNAEPVAAETASANGATANAAQSIEIVIAEMADAAKPKREVSIVAPRTTLANAVAERLAAMRATALMRRTEIARLDQATARTDENGTAVNRAEAREPYTLRSAIDEIMSGMTRRGEPSGQEPRKEPPAASPTAGDDTSAPATQADSRSDGDVATSAVGVSRAVDDPAERGRYTIQSAIEEIETGLKYGLHRAKRVGPQSAHPPAASPADPDALEPPPSRSEEHPRSSTRRGGTAGASRIDPYDASSRLDPSARLARIATQLARGDPARLARLGTLWRARTTLQTDG